MVANDTTIDQIPHDAHVGTYRSMYGFKSKKKPNNTVKSAKKDHDKTTKKTIIMNNQGLIY